VVEDVDVAASHVLVHTFEAATRQCHQPVTAYLMAVLQPAQEGNPVENFIADLRQPRSGDDRSARRGNRGDLLID
jgi:hypothetical protein